MLFIIYDNKREMSERVATRVYFDEKLKDI